MPNCKKDSSNSTSSTTTEVLSDDQVKVDIKRGYVTASGRVSIAIMPEEKFSVELLDLEKIYIGNEEHYYVEPIEVNLEPTENVAMCIFKASGLIDYLSMTGIKDGTIYINAYLKEPISFDLGLTYYDYVWGSDKIKTIIGRRKS